MLKYKDIVLEGKLSDSTQSKSLRVDTILQDILVEEKRVAEDLKSTIEEVDLGQTNDHLQFGKRSELADLIPEGLVVGWDSYLDSDMAADAYAELEDLHSRNKDNSEQLKSVFEIWLKRFVVEPYGTDVDLEGWHAIALISKEPLFKEIVQTSQLDVRPYMRTALQTLWDEEKQGGETIPGPEGLKKLIQWIIPWT